MTDFCDINDEIKDDICNTFYLTKTASTMATVSSTITVIASIISISVISRSQIGLSSVYHRIIFFMSILDLIGSTAMALTTIPMPKDQIYAIEGRTYGTVATCEAQGILFLYGIGGSFHYSSGLCLFYLCIIVFQMSDRKIRRYLEPSIHFFSNIIPFSNVVIFWFLDLFNVSPFETWCSVGAYPWECNNIEGAECIRGGNVSPKVVAILKQVIAGTIGLAAINVLVCMGLIICRSKIYLHSSSNTDETTSNIQDNDNPVDAERNRQAAKAKMDVQKLSNTLTNQALMYIFVFMFTWTIPTVLLFVRRDFLDAFKLAFIPLQGFYNSSIFLYHKAHNIRRFDPNVTTWWKAFYHVIVQPNDVPEIQLTGISRLDVVQGATNTQPQIIVEEGVDEASKDMNLSYGQELSFVLGFNSLSTTEIKQLNLGDEQFQGSQFSMQSSESQVDFVDNSIFSYSETDIATIKAGN